MAYMYWSKYTSRNMADSFNLCLNGGYDAESKKQIAELEARLQDWSRDLLPKNLAVYIIATFSRSTLRGCRYEGFPGDCGCDVAAL